MDCGKLFHRAGGVRARINLFGLRHSIMKCVDWKKLQNYIQARARKKKFYVDHVNVLIAGSTLVETWTGGS